MSSFKKRPNKKRGGTRENAGRKSIWINQDTCTIRVPKIFAGKLHEIAQKWDKKEFNDFVSQSNSDSETGNFGKDENVTKSNLAILPPITSAIDLAKQILFQKKSARISLARFLSKLYSTPVRFEDLK